MGFLIFVTILYNKYEKYILMRLHCGLSCGKLLPPALIEQIGNMMPHRGGVFCKEGAAHQSLHSKWGTRGKDTL